MTDKQPEKIVSAGKSYKIIKPLGEGGTSIVYLAEDKKGKQVALKIIGADVEQSIRDRYIETIKNEFDLLSKLRHPNIAQVYDFEFSQELGKYFFTTEYVEGVDLYNFTADASVQVKEELFVQLLSALDYLHRNGIVHCDIKCGNVLVTTIKKQIVSKLVDFGFATQKLDSRGYVVGTLSYMAPELLLQMKELDHRVDIYSAGIVLYRILHRINPCPHTEMKDVIKWHRERGDFKYADSIPDYLKQIIRRMTATFPTDRISSCGKAIEFVNDRTEGRYKDIVSRIEGLQPGEGQLVGRDQVIAEIEPFIAALKEKRAVEGIGVLITGREGFGKSRIMREIKYRAQLAELKIVEFLCSPTGDQIGEFLNSFPDVPVQSFGVLDTSKPDPERRYKVMQWVNGWIDAYKDKGLLIMVDDLQFAGSAFADFLKNLDDRLKVRRAQGETISIFFLIATRPDPEIPEHMKAFVTSQSVRTVELKPLTTEDITRYVEFVGIRDAEKAVPAIMDFSGGVPQLVEAYCHHLQSPEGMAKPPENLAQSYRERFEALPKAARNLLGVISVSERPLDPIEIEALVSIKQPEIVASLQHLYERGFAKVVMPSRNVIPGNKALAQIVKQTLSEEERKGISLKLGELLESKDKEASFELAVYFDEAGLPAKAREYALASAAKLEQKFNGSEARKYYDMAIKYESDEAKLAGLRRSLAKLNIFMGKYNEAIVELQKLLESPHCSLDDFRFLGIAFTKKHDFKEARKWYEEGLKRVTDETAITDIVSFKNNLGNICLYTGALDESEHFFTEAIADATVCLLLNNSLGLIYNAKGSYDQAVSFYEARKRYLEAKKNKRALSQCNAEIGYIHMTNNRNAQAIEAFETSYKLAVEIEDWHNILVVLGNMVRIYQQTCQYTRALDHAKKSLEYEGKVGSLEDIAQNHLTLGILYETLGILDLSAQHINKAHDRFAASGNKMMLGWTHLTMSFVHKDMDKFEDSLSELNEAEKMAEGAPDFLAWVLYTKADLYCEYQKFEEAKNALSAIKPPAKAIDFNLRYRLLRLKVDLVFKAGGETIEELIKLADDCSKNEFKELEWEIYAALGDAHEKQKNAKEAEAAFRNAYAILSSIAEDLSDAYRDSYKYQRFRKRIIEKFEKVIVPSAGGSGGESPPKDSGVDSKTSELK